MDDKTPPDAEVVDPELVDLLSDLEGGQTKSVKDLPPAETEAPSSPISAPVSLGTQNPGLGVAQPQDPSQEVNEVREIISNFRDIRDEIFKNYKSDREQAEKAIKMFEENIKNKIVTQAIIDGFVQALRIKTDVNANAVGLLDAQARLLSAGKGSPLFVQNVGVSPQELKEILQAPLYSDEQQEPS